MTDQRIATDAGKLRTLAAWLDGKYPKDGDREVQEDLARIATLLER